MNTSRRVNRNDIVSHKNTYVYKKIDGHREIRLLKLIHGAAEAPLEGILFTTTFSPPSDNGLSPNPKPCTYTALSYCWGPDEPRNPILMYVEENDNKVLPHLTSTLPSGIFYVQDNLNAALRQLRDPKVDVIIWADAICIDQSDSQEKSGQIARMDEIYTRASNVCDWLVTETAQSKETFPFFWNMGSKARSHHGKGRRAKRGSWL